MRTRPVWVLWAVVVVVGVVAAVDLGVPAGPLLEGLALVGATAAGLVAAGSLPDRPPHGRPRRDRDPPEEPLDRARAIVTVGTRSAAGRHHTLVPVLRGIAEHCCRRHGTTLADEEGARLLLGHELHALVTPAERRPRDPRAPGVDPVTLVAGLERLARL